MIELSENGPETRPGYVIFEFERRAYPVGAEPFTIGRAGSCDVVIREPAVSRVHAELARTGRGIVLKPVGATPTMVNGAPLVAESLLRHGDRIEIGSAKLTFSESPLPIGVSIIDRSHRRISVEEIANRRTTITNPILSGRANPNQSARTRIFRPTVLVGILAAVAAYYFGVILR